MSSHNQFAKKESIRTFNEKSKIATKNALFGLTTLLLI